MRNAKWRTPPPVRPRADNGWDESRRNVAGVGELKAVAERILETGAHYLQQGRDWFETATATRSEEDMGTRSRQHWQQGAASDDAQGRASDRHAGTRAQHPWERGGHGRYQEDDMYRASPRYEGDAHDSAYAPDEYSFRETGERGSSRTGYDYDDHRTRAFDYRADELARRDPARREPGRSAPGRGEYLPGSYGYGGEGRLEPGNLRRARPGPGDRTSPYAGGDDLHGWEQAYQAQGYGSQRGHGPRGYARSDERILEDVSERLTDDPVVDARGVDVRCESGRIVLEGQVPTRWMKHRAEDIADSIAGASDVDNRIRVAAGDGAASGGQDRAAGAGVEAGAGTQRSSGTTATADPDAGSRGTTTAARDPSPQSPH